MKKVLILSYSSINRDPRVLRQIQFFKKNFYDITLCGIDYAGDLPFYPIKSRKTNVFRVIKLFLMIFRLNRLREREFLFHSSLESLKVQKPFFDLLVANDVETWPLAAALKSEKPEAKLILDAHEHYSKHFNDRLIWRWFHKRYINYVCEQYIPKADKFITVCEGIAVDYAKEYGVNPHLILNTPDFEPDLTPTPVQEKIRIIHHGIANRSRKIEKMIFMMDHLDSRFELYVMLLEGDSGYLAELKELAKDRKIEFLAPVQTSEISIFINRFDIGIFILEPVNFNYANALPNKFFEFIQARLAVAIGPSPEMKKIVLAEKNGVVTDSFDEKEMALVLNGLSREQIQQLKENSHQIAWRYSNFKNENVMFQLLEDLNLLQVHPDIQSVN